MLRWMYAAQCAHRWLLANIGACTESRKYRQHINSDAPILQCLAWLRICCAPRICCMCELDIYLMEDNTVILVNLVSAVTSLCASPWSWCSCTYNTYAIPSAIYSARNRLTHRFFLVVWLLLLLCANFVIFSRSLSSAPFVVNNFSVLSLHRLFTCSPLFFFFSSSSSLFAFIFSCFSILLLVLPFLHFLRWSFSRWSPSSIISFSSTSRHLVLAAYSIPVPFPDTSPLTSPFTLAAAFRILSASNVFDSIIKSCKYIPFGIQTYGTQPQPCHVFITHADLSHASIPLWIWHANWIHINNCGSLHSRAFPPRLPGVPSSSRCFYS